jgi:alpha-1,6-mannosyltransferase
MRIVQLANFATPTSGGIRTVLAALGSGYRAAGHERVLVVPGAVDERRVDEHGLVVQVAAPVLPRSGGYRLIITPRRVLRLLEELETDAVEVSDRTTLLPVGPWARSAGVPALAIAHERADALLARRLPGGTPRRWLADANARSLADRFDTIVCASSWSQSEFTRLGLVGTVRVPLGVDLGLFAPVRRRPELHRELLAGGDVALIHVGRLSPEKRPDLAIACLAELRRRGVNARLTMVGDGPLRDGLELAAEDLPVRFAGHLPGRADVAALLASADVALCPGPIESFGLAALEALACGTPIVTQRTGAVSELLQGEASGLAAFSHPRAMAAAVLQLLEHTPDARCHAARTAAERFPWSATVQRMLTLHGALPARGVSAPADPALRDATGASGRHVAITDASSSRRSVPPRSI